MPNRTYAFANARPGQLERLRLLEATFDAGTFARLAAAGIPPGARCLEVGAGGGSVAAWLAERAGPDGHVLATDLDTQHLDGVARANLEVRVHDLRTDPLPEHAFDVVHARFVLAWLAEPAAALARLVAALRTGGLLLVEELDFISLVVDPHVPAGDRAAFERVVAAHHAALAARTDFDPFHGRAVEGALTEAGLAMVTSAVEAQVWRGGEPGARLFGRTLAQLRDGMLAVGAAAADVDRATALCEDGLVAIGPLVVAAWGRRPGTLRA